MDADVFQEVWLSCLQNYSPDKGSWENYFNKTLFWEKKKESCRASTEASRSVELTENLVSHRGSPLRYAIRQERRRVLGKALKQLSPKYRRLIKDHILNEYPLRCSGDPSISRKALNKALHELRRLLEWQGYRKEYL